MTRALPAGTLLLLLSAASAASDDGPDPAWPVHFDAEARRVFDAWEVREYAPGRLTDEAVEAEVEIAAVAPEARPMVRGTYRFASVESEFPTRPGSLVGAEHGFWRLLLDTSLHALGWRRFLRDAKVTAEAEEGGTKLCVDGPSPLRALVFDRDGRLARVTLTGPDETGAVVTQDVRTTFARYQGKDVLTGTRIERDVPGFGPGVEEVSLAYERTAGLLLPRRIDYRVQAARGEAHVGVTFSRWRVGAAATVEMEGDARWLLEDWERNAYEPGRLGLRSASCRFEFLGPRGAPLAAGAYRWDGRQGQVTWDDGAMANAFGRIPWPLEVGRVLAPYATRSEFALASLRRRDAGDHRFLDARWAAGTPGRGLLGLEFDAEGRWVGGTILDDDGTEGTLAVRHETFRHGEQDLQRLVSWAETYRGVVRRRVTLTYAWSGGFALPAALRREAVQGGEARGCLIRFRDWQVDAPDPVRFPP